VLAIVALTRRAARFGIGGGTALRVERVTQRNGFAAALGAADFARRDGGDMSR